MDPYKILNLITNPDGTITRSNDPPLSPAFPDGEPLPDSTTTVLSKDIPLNPSNGTTIRLFVPSHAPSKSLPLILYFHGGGFVLFQAASVNFHAACVDLAASVPAIVASVDYRLAPEHRLPAAFDDARDAIVWAQSAVESDPWVREFAALSKFFLMGSSAGASICYHVGLDLNCSRLDISPLRLAGLILDQPYFGGIERTGSELQYMNDKIIPLPVNDALWELALPVGADRDHEYCNVVAKEARDVKLLPRCLVRGHVGDPLFDRQKAFVEMLKRAGVNLVEKMGTPGYHGIEMFKPEKAALMADDVKNFVYGLGAKSAVPANRPEHKL